jgi:hypothetical protein
MVGIALLGWFSGIGNVDPLGAHSSDVRLEMSLGRCHIPMRTIILLLDWDSTLFWRDAEGGGRIDEATLPIRPELRRRLDDYYKHYSELYYRDTTRPVPELEKRLLDNTGLEIWEQLRAELAGIYRVLFYSDELEDSFENPEEFVARRKVVYAT